MPETDGLTLTIRMAVLVVIVAIFYFTLKSKKRSD